MKKVTVLLVPAIVAALAVLVPTIASGQTEIHVIATYGRVTAVDVHEDGELGPGDPYVARGPALDATGTDRVGSVYWDCMIERAIDGDGRGVCDAVLKLEDGEIMLRGLDPEGAGEAPLAVLGGSDAYSGAQGDGTWTDAETDLGWVTDIVIHLAA